MSALVATLAIGGVGVTIYMLATGRFKWESADGANGEAASVMAAAQAAQAELGKSWHERITEDW